MSAEYDKVLQAAENAAFIIRSNTLMIGDVIRKANKLDAWEALHKIDECAPMLEKALRECGWYNR